MVWIDSIQELDFYRRSPSGYCYCDLLIQPSDLTLQGVLRPNSQANLLKIFMYSVDGLTQIADVTAYFAWYIANISGRSFFSARLNRFPQEMCDNKCFILRVMVADFELLELVTSQVRFDRYTQQYCLADCCTVADGVSISGPGVIPHDVPLPTDITSMKDPACRPLIRMEVAFDCVDRWTGDFWRIPLESSYVSGSVGAANMFAYTKVLNLAGTLQDVPREIKRTISLNGNVQRTESTARYEVQSYEEFPLWKMREISDMLHAPFLRFNGIDYQYPGGTPFQRLYSKVCSRQYFRLVLPLQNTVQYQNFGCADRCEGDNLKYYALRYSAALYYDDAGRVIGGYDDLLTWFNTTGGGTVLTAITGGTVLLGGGFSSVGSDVERPPSDDPWKAHTMDHMALSTDYYEIIEATGDNLPAYFYADGTRPANRIYAQELPYGDFNSLFGVGPNPQVCATPVFGTLTYSELTCDVPIIGTPIFTDECKMPVLGTAVYGDLDEPPPTGTGTYYIDLEDGTGEIESEISDLLIQE